MNDAATVDTIARGLDRWNGMLGRQFGPLSRPQRRIMQLLARQPETRVGSLAANLSVTPAGTTKMLDLLEREGYVRRVRRPDSDQRQVFVCLTPAGWKALRQANLAFTANVGNSLAGLTDAQRGALADALSQIGAGTQSHNGAEAG